MNHIESLSHNAATIQITQTYGIDGYNIAIRKNKNETLITRRTLEQARKAGRYYAERM